MSTVGPPDQLLTPVDVARWLALSEAWVREHAAELGAVKLGADPRAPLRFPRRGVEEWLDWASGDPPAAKDSRRTREAPTAPR